jgi:ATP-dependent RNA helicase RhlE
LVGDIEKLLKSKIELEAIEFDEDAPDIRKQGRINDGRRMYAGNDGEREGGQREGARNSNRDSSREHGRDRDQAARPPRRDFSRPTPASRDPFFDKPYEATAATSDAAAPTWEATAKRPVRSISANIKPKQRVAALFKATTPALS